MPENGLIDPEKMNYLAHCYFSTGTQNSLYGNVLGDFVKGHNHGFLEQEITDGIALHRAIDKFTDNHPTVRKSKHRISDKRKRFAGIMIDVFYDHFLAMHWEKFSPYDFDTQINEWYSTLNAETNIELPERMKIMISQLTKHDWFSGYKTQDGISASIDGISRRIRFENTLAGGGIELVQNYSLLENDFLEFFPLLKRYVLRYEK